MSQINTTVGDIRANVAKINNQIGCARDKHADIVMFPELAICGYPPEDLLLKPAFLKDTCNALQEVVKESHGISVIIGFPDESHGNVYNAAALIDNSKLVDIYHKVELPNYGVFDEKRYFKPGEGALFFDIKGIRFMVTVCEDIWVNNGKVERFAIENNAMVVLNISSSPFHAGKLALRRKIISHFAKRTGSCVCYTNLVGGQDELVFDGGSLVVNPKGEKIANAKRFNEDLLMVDIEISHRFDTHSSKVNDEKINCFVLKKDMLRDKNPIPQVNVPELGRLEEIYEALILGTRDYVNKNGFKKVLIGLSGGIDSALTAAIAVDALGSENVIVVSMPSEYTSDETFSDSKLMAANLNVSFLTIPIKKIFFSYLKSLKDSFGTSKPGIEYENIQARIRGNILMALSNKFGWLVLTTGNKSEIAVGYCTLYGDMAGGFAVIKDLPKTMVYEIASYINQKKGRDIILKSIIDRPPTAELKHNQKDEDFLPPYSRLDPILRCYVEEDKSPGEIIKFGFDRETVNQVIKMVDKNEYKRRQAPPGIKITPKAFGKDRRLPITNHY